MNVLCIDHACHKKTKSFDFFVDILRAAVCLWRFIIMSGITV